MCLAILNNTILLDKSVFTNAWRQNPDGGGISYILEGKIIIEKELKSVEKFYKLYKTARKKTLLPMIIHFRYSTAGKLNTENTHPFFISKTLVFCHNGIISGLGDLNISDTVQFNRDVLKKLPTNFLDMPAITELISKYIGGSKLIFLDNLGGYNIINESMGHWLDGDWYSNYGYIGHTYETSKKFKWFDGDFCEYCGLELLSNKEKENGVCTECESELKAEYCSECGGELLTQFEELNGICSYCYKLYND